MTAKKKAYLVDFSLCTRVIVNREASDNTIIAKAIKRIKENLDEKLIGDNCTGIEEDLECPYGTSPLDSKEDL